MDKSGGSNSPAEKSANGATPSAPAKVVVIPQGTEIHVTLDQSLGSKTSQSGMTFDASLSDDVAVDGVVAIPKGARAYGVVSDAKPAGRFKGGAVLAITLKSVKVNDKSYQIETSTASRVSKGKGKRTAAMVGGGAAGGAIIGALAGGGKGAAIGAIVGGGAGAGGAGFTGDRDITLPAETHLTFKLQQDLPLN